MKLPLGTVSAIENTEQTKQENYGLKRRLCLFRVRKMSNL